jgi:hypothetical protein
LIKQANTGRPADKTGRFAPPGAALGISAKSFANSCAENAGISAEKYRAARRSKFEMLRTAQRILYDPNKSAAAQHRTCWCHRGTPTGRDSVGVFRRADASGARLQGVTTCGSVWACSICSARIAEQRRDELETLLKAAIAEGHHAYLMTLTFPHQAGDQLADLLDRKARALAKFKACRAYKALKAQFGRVGSVRSMECTYGENGWHPHTHDVIIAKPGLLDAAETIRNLRDAWIDALAKVGLCASWERADAEKHAFDLRGGAYTAEYVSKFGRDAAWGIAREVTGQRAKVGMRAGLGDGHCTPFQVLAWAQTGDGEACALFRVYCEAYQGKRMLYWSPGLKVRYGIDDLDDDAAAEADRPDEAKVGTITVEQLGQLHARRALGQFIELAATHCNHQNDAANQAELDDILDVLIAAPPDSSGMIRQKAQRGYSTYDPTAPVDSPRRFPLH